MRKKNVFLAMGLFVFLGLAQDGFALLWDDTAADPNDHSWCTAANWQNDTLPWAGLAVKIDTFGTTHAGPVINSGCDAVCGELRVETGQGNIATAHPLTINGGTLTSTLNTKDIMLGAAINTWGKMIVNGGVVKGSRDAWIGNNGEGILIMNGGKMDIPGTLYIPRGTAAAGLRKGHVQLNGGGILCGGFVMRTGNQTGTLDIAGGALIINGDMKTTVEGYIANGWITANKTATDPNLYDPNVVPNVDYDNVVPGKTVVWTGDAPYVPQTDLNDDGIVDIDDLNAMAEDWLFKTPSQVVWSFNMDSTPVGTGVYDLKVRNTSNGTYTMGTDDGRSVLMTGEGGLLLDSQFPVIDDRYDATLHYVVKPTDTKWVNLWLHMVHRPTGVLSRLGCTVNRSSADPNYSNVQLWRGNSPNLPPFDPLVLTGFNRDSYLTIDVSYHYDPNTFDYTVTDGTKTLSGTGVGFHSQPNTVLSNGNFWTIQNTSTSPYGGYGHVYIDQLDYTIYGCSWYGTGDFQPDGSVDLKDFALLAGEWLTVSDL